MGFAGYPVTALPVQTLATGGKIAYLSYQALPGSGGNTALYAAHLSTRTAAGWQTNELTPAVPPAPALKVYEVSYSLSEDLSQAVLRVPIVQLTPEATPNAYNLYLRNTESTGAGVSYSSVNSTKPIVAVEEMCAPEELESCFEYEDESSFAGASSDYSHILFESNAQLTPEAPLTGTSSLYEKSGGGVRLVGVLPDETPAQTSWVGAASNILEYVNGEQATEGRVERAISKDGSRVVFEAPADGGEPDSEQTAEQIEVYDRIGGEETVELSAPAPGSSPAVTTPESATFWTASSDGSRVFFTSSAELTTQSNTGTENNGSDLYEYNVDTKTLTDLTVDTNPEDASTGPRVQGVVDSSKDGAYIYFVAYGRLVPGKGVEEQPNLYVVHNGGQPIFLATLNSAGSCEFLGEESADSCDWTRHAPQLEAYVTPDGRHMAFMSTMSLPTTNFPEGYDNTDQATGEKDSEVYSFSAPTSEEETHGESGRLLCASCDPSGAPPVGNALIGGISQIAEPRPGLWPYLGVSTPFYRVQAMNDAGTRLFYTAPAPLAGPDDKVFEFEQDGEGSCAEAGGCRFKLSGPSQSESDEFLGSSASGEDAYLVSSSRLSSTDEDNLRDVFDVRAGGGFPAKTSEPPCDSNCQQGVLPAGPPALQSGFNGKSGNLAPPPAIKPKPLTRAQKLAKALKGCRTKHNKHKRAVCEAAARHRYGPTKHAKAGKANVNRRVK